jgi:hypothetical protein
MEGSKGITPAYLAWKRAGSPGFIWCLACDQAVGPEHTHNHRLTMSEWLAAVNQWKRTQ